jgi:ATP:ADP antiporter, AAA family
MAAATAVVMIAQQVASKAVRDALFLSSFAPEVLPIITVSAAGLSVVMVLLIGRLMRRFSPARLVPVLFVVSAGLYLLEWWGSGRVPRAVAVIVYLHTATFGGAVVSGFWSAINERFDPYTARRVIGTIAGGATAGGLLGGLAAWQAASVVSLPTMITALAAANLVCAAALRRVGESDSQRAAVAPTGPAGTFDSLKTIRQSSYLKHIALFVGLGALGESCFDFVLKATASTQLGSAGELVSFFAIFYTVVGAATFIVQSTATKRVLSRFGLVGTLGAMPIAVLALGTCALVFPMLWAFVLLRGAALLIENSLYRSGYELLYTPIPAAQKRSAKLVIDLGCDRVGAALGSSLTLGVLALFGMASAPLIGISVTVASALLFILVLVNRGYIASLEQSLRAGTGEASAAGVVVTVDSSDGAALTLADGRSRIIASENLRGRLRASLESQGVRPPPEPPPEREPLLESPPPTLPFDELTKEIGTLSARDPGHARRILGRHRLLPRALVGPAIALLDIDSLTAEVRARLTTVAPRAVGQLVDVLLDPHSELRTRLEVAAILGAVPMRRAIDGLCCGLQDTSFTIRRAAARALLDANDRMPGNAAPPQVAFDAAIAELSMPLRPPVHTTDLERSSFGSDQRGSPVSPTLDYVFTLFALTLGRSSVQLAFHALGSSDLGSRGTGLEYLENVLPLAVRAALSPHLQADASGARPPQHVIDELGHALMQTAIGLETLRERFRAAKAAAGICATSAR